MLPAHLPISSHAVMSLKYPSPPPYSTAPWPQSADPQHLLLAAVPFSERAGTRVLLVYDASSAGEVRASVWQAGLWDGGSCLLVG